MAEKLIHFRERDVYAYAIQKSDVYATPSVHHPSVIKSTCICVPVVVIISI